MGEGIIERLLNPAWIHSHASVSATATLDEGTAVADMKEAAEEIQRLSALWIAETRENEHLRKALSAAKGYLMNAKIDLETGARKKTALNTIEGGLRMIEAALVHPDERASLNIHHPSDEMKPLPE